MQRKFTKSIKFAETMNGKSIVIMGATSGIGREVAEISLVAGGKWEHAGAETNFLKV